MTEKKLKQLHKLCNEAFPSLDGFPAYTIESRKFDGGLWWEFSHIDGDAITSGSFSEFYTKVLQFLVLNRVQS